MNAFKATVSWFFLALSMFWLGTHVPSMKSVGYFMLSGLVGLNFGDLFLLSAFVRLGSSRTLMIFGFQPLLIGAASFFLFGQEVGTLRFLSLIFLIGCLFFFSLEKYKQEGHWEVRGLVFALIGMSLDAVGILLTRSAFDHTPNLMPLEGHFYRCTGAVVGFMLMSLWWKPLNLVPQFMKWRKRERLLLVTASFLGTFLSLLLYLTAVRIGHLASLSGIAVTGPLFASLLELAWKKERPSRYSLAALFCFLVGFYLLMTLQ